MGPIDWIAVGLATLAAFAVGMVWYGALFGKPWRAALGIREGQSPNTGMATLFGGNLVLLLASAFMLGHMFARAPGLKDHLYFMMAGGVALFFVIPSLWINYLYQQQKRALALIDAGYWLCAYLAMGAVFWALR